MQTNEFLYSCPHCSGEVLVSKELMATEVSCPHCSAGFFATPYQPTPSVATTAQEPAKEAESQPSAGLPVKIPFFKFNRTKILSQKLDELTRDGVLDDSDGAELTALAAHLKLSVADLTEVRKKKAFAELEAMRKRIEKFMWVTDGDLESFARISRKYALNVKMEGYTDIFRAIYLLEAKNQPPAPVSVKIPLKSNECCYLKMETVWLQPRVQTKAYGGASVSIPSGIKGVRFRVGSVAPIRSEEITPLSEGTLYVTNKRVIFVGGSRSTTIPLSKIVEAEPFSDSVKFAKATGRPDFFSMDCGYSRLIVGLVNHFGAEGEDTD